MILPRLTLLLAVAVSCASAVLTRADGLIGYPGQDNERRGYPASEYVPYATPSRIRIKLTRIIQNLDDDQMKEPQVSYFGALGVGTPPKLFNVVFDTGSNEIWLPYYNWFPLANNLHYSKGYDCKDSSTCVRTDKEYKSDYRGTRLSGSMYEDTLTLYDGLTKDEISMLLPNAQLSFGQNFLAISDAGNEQFRWKPYDGVVGLAPVAHSASGTRNLLLSIQALHATNGTGQQLYQEPYGSSAPNYGPYASYPSVAPSAQPYPPSYNGASGYYSPDQEYARESAGYSGLVNPNGDLVFSFWFSPQQNARDAGELMLGGIDGARYVGEIAWHRVSSWFDWQLKLRSVQLGNQVVSCQYGCQAVLDTGANSVVGPREDVQRIHEELGARYDSDAGIWLVDCNTMQQLPVLSFNIDSNPYMLYPSHYVKMFRFRERLICHLAIKPHDSQNWILGTSFVGAYYTMFNFSRRLIGFATPRA